MRTKQEIQERFADRGELDGYERFFLVGIGGAGMEGVARMLHSRGFQVSGVDRSDGETVRALRESGIEVCVGAAPERIRSDHAVILTDAVDLKTSVEVARAEKLGAKLFRRSQALGWLLRENRTVAVTGTHGKTTTSGMVAAGLRAAGLEPTIVIGAAVPEFGSSTVDAGEIAVIEACEAYDAIRDLDPHVAILTNLELDHVDFHEDFAALQASVQAFVDRIPEDGLLLHSGDPGAQEIAERFAGAKRSYGAEGWSGPQLTLPGEHSRENAAGALAACVALGADEARAAEGIAKFRGAQRRMQVLQTEGTVVIDDYAHHPTEITATLRALRERYEGRRLIAVFQPHLYSRTLDQEEAFAKALDVADHVVLTDIYPAREDPIPGVSSLRIVEHLTKPNRYVPSRFLLPRVVANLAKPEDVVVTMGAGNIDQFPRELMEELKPRPRTKVAVLYGGDSAEREVSILTGRQVRGALEDSGYDVVEIDATERLLEGEALPELVGPCRPDVVFPCVHGTHAEDGAIQGLLELLHLPYVGSGIQASQLAMDKAHTKRVLASHGIDVPRGFAVRKGEALPADLDQTADWVVKPNAQGSTVGLSFVKGGEGLSAAIARALDYDDTALIEEWIQGVELSVPVVGEDALPAVEIVPKSGRYDFAAKYVPDATAEICPARISDANEARARETALRAHRALGCEDLSRTDLLLDEKSDRMVVLEVNTLPGMTATSLTPASAKQAGKAFATLVCELVEGVIARRAQKV